MSFIQSAEDEVGKVFHGAAGLASSAVSNIKKVVTKVKNYQDAQIKDTQAKLKRNGKGYY